MREQTAQKRLASQNGLSGPKLANRNVAGAMQPIAPTTAHSFARSVMGIEGPRSVLEFVFSVIYLLRLISD